MRKRLRSLLHIVLDAVIVIFSLYALGVFFQLGLKGLNANSDFEVFGGILTMVVAVIIVFGMLYTLFVPQS